MDTAASVTVICRDWCVFNQDFSCRTTLDSRSPSLADMCHTSARHFGDLTQENLEGLIKPAQVRVCGRIGASGSGSLRTDAFSDVTEPTEVYHSPAATGKPPSDITKQVPITSANKGVGVGLASAACFFGHSEATTGSE